jgi:hypothetical protein
MNEKNESRKVYLILMLSLCLYNKILFDFKIFLNKLIKNLKAKKFNTSFIGVKSFNCALILFLKIKINFSFFSTNNLKK